MQANDQHLYQKYSEVFLNQPATIHIHLVNLKSKNNRKKLHWPRWQKIPNLMSCQRTRMMETEALASD